MASPTPEPRLADADPRRMTVLAIAQLVVTWSVVAVIFGALVMWLVPVAAVVFTLLSNLADRTELPDFWFTVITAGGWTMAAGSVTGVVAAIVVTWRPLTASIDSPARHVARWGFLGAIGLTIAAELASRLLPSNNGLALTQAGINFAAVLSAAVGIVALSLYLAAIALRIADQDLARRTIAPARVLRWAVPLYATIGAALRVDWILLGVESRITQYLSIGAMAAGIVVIVQLGPLAFAMFDYHKIFGEHRGR